MPTARSACGALARPATVSGGSTGAYWLAASAMSSTESNSKSAPRGTTKRVRSTGGVAAENSSNADVKAGVARPLPNTSTRSTTPVSGSAQTSTWSMLVCAAAGTSRSPSASTPATRAAGSRRTSDSSTSSSRRSATSGGTRSAVRGSRMAGSRLRVTSSCS